MGPEGSSLAGRGDRARFLPLEARCVAPQTLEVVERALVRSEDVDDDVDVVQEPPAGVALALAARGTDVELLPQRAFDLLDDRLDLPGRRRRADHEVIGD